MFSTFLCILKVNMAVDMVGTPIVKLSHVRGNCRIAKMYFNAGFKNFGYPFYRGDSVEIVCRNLNSRSFILNFTYYLLHICLRAYSNLSKETSKFMQAQSQEKETLSKEREAHKVEVQAQMCEFRKMSDELKSEFEEVARMQKEMENQIDNMVVDVVARVFLQLSKVTPNFNSDSLKEAIGSSISSFAGNRRVVLGDVQTRAYKF